MLALGRDLGWAVPWSICMWPPQHGGLWWGGGQAPSTPGRLPLTEPRGDPVAFAPVVCHFRCILLVEQPEGHTQVGPASRRRGLLDGRIAVRPHVLTLPRRARSAGHGIRPRLTLGSSQVWDRFHALVKPEARLVRLGSHS